MPIVVHAFLRVALVAAVVFAELDAVAVVFVGLAVVAFAEPVAVEPVSVALAEPVAVELVFVELAEPAVVAASVGLAAVVFAEPVAVEPVSVELAEPAVVAASVGLVAVVFAVESVSLVPAQPVEFFVSVDQFVAAFACFVAAAEFAVSSPQPVAGPGVLLVAFAVPVVAQYLADSACLVPGG